MLMMKHSLTIIIATFTCSLLYAQPVPHQREEKPLVKGMKITGTTKIKAGVYKLDAADSLDQPIIIIEGKNITARSSEILAINSHLPYVFLAHDPAVARASGMMLSSSWLSSETLGSKKLKYGRFVFLTLRLG